LLTFSSIFRPRNDSTLSRFLKKEEQGYNKFGKYFNNKLNFVGIQREEREFGNHS